MKSAFRLVILKIILAAWCPVALSQASDEIEIVYPHANAMFTRVQVRVKTNLLVPSGAVEEINLLADGNLVGVVTQPPYTFVWGYPVGWGLKNGNDSAFWGEIKAVAVLTNGVVIESKPVPVTILINPPSVPIVNILSPQAGGFIPEGKEFTFSAEVLANVWRSSPIPIEFYVGTNLVGRVTQDPETVMPFSTVVSGLPRGVHKLNVRYPGLNGFYCECPSIDIHVGNLGIQSVQLVNNLLEFQVTTAYLGKETILQKSADLNVWSSISTNVPNTNQVRLIAPTPTSNPQFYRVMVSP
ncbi:MAG: Ig-like domain-containing protein [Verrucomicrobiales bacterium]|nr:Ig-like domain-containing protein [Verrucomicrobiales bacterium]